MGYFKYVYKPVATKNIFWKDVIILHGTNIVSTGFIFLQGGGDIGKRI